MSARVTMNLTPDGLFELWLNEEGRDALVRELQRLDNRHDHFHLGTWEAEIPLCTKPYRSTDTVLSAGKVIYRTDEWDLTHFPHVIDDPSVAKVTTGARY